MRLLIVGLLVLLGPAVAQAQLWSGIITPPRAVDWSNVGVQGGIPDRPSPANNCATLNPGATAAQINSAISACPGAPGLSVVFLNAGTYNLSSGIELGKSGVTVRGAGANQTILNINGQANSCHLFYTRAFNICTNPGGNIGSDGGDNTATWSAACLSTGTCQGVTTITLSQRANLNVGSMIWLDQVDETGSSQGFPSSGDVWTLNWGNAESFMRPGRGVSEGKLVASCGTSTPGAACTSNTITLSDPIRSPVFRTLQTPGAYWGAQSLFVHDSGVEDLTIDTTSSNINVLMMINVYNCWAKGVRSIRANNVTPSGQRTFHVVQGIHTSVVDNYIYGFQSNDLIDKYGGITQEIISESLIQTNIVQAAVNPMIPNSGFYGNVWGYNYFNNVGISSSFSQSPLIMHGTGQFNLFEGNDGARISADNIHAGHFFQTLFRNHFNGQAFNPGSGETQSAFPLYAYQRFFNYIGNVAGNSEWSQYQTAPNPDSSNCQGCIWLKGWRGTNSNGSAQGDDARTAITLGRWGNWDHVTSANDNGTNDATGTRFVASEVPTGITSYANSLPASQILPASFYLAAKPTTWWNTPSGEPPWPPIGPEVVSGNVNNGSTEPTGGHVNKIPARICFETSANDPNYPQDYGGIAGSPRIKSFNRASCYLASPAGGPPAAPTGLQVVP